MKCWNVPSHQPLGTRDLDTARFLDTLHESVFAGPIILELTVQQAAASLAEIRRLRPEYITQRIR